MKRPYSQEFTPPDGKGKDYVLQRIPTMLYTRAQAKAKREGISLRALILGWLKDWIEK